MKRIYFDSETDRLPDSDLLAVMPEFEAPGNYKNPESIEKAKDEKRASWIERAALSPVSGKVLAIGIRDSGANIILSDNDEASNLRGFWAAVDIANRDGHQLVGFNIARFDVPFLVKRSWKLGVRPSRGLYNGRYLNNKLFIDLYQEWQCGDSSESISLKRLAEFLGVGTKSDDGKNFGKLWATNKSMAIAYLENDLILTEAVADRILGPGLERRADSIMREYKEQTNY